MLKQFFFLFPLFTDLAIFYRVRHLSLRSYVFFEVAFGGGSWLSFETDDVDGEYARLQAAGVPIVAEIRDETWGDRHFVIEDPNGIGVDVYQRMK